MPIDQTQKPQFYEGQYISADDLTGILQFSSVLQARHAIGAHTWGLAMGFDLLEKPVGSSPSPVNVFLQPGYAWDGFGRPIVALATYQIPPERFAAYTYNAAIDEPNGRLVEIWIGSARLHSNRRQADLRSAMGRRIRGCKRRSRFMLASATPRYCSTIRWWWLDTREMRKPFCRN